MKATLKAALNSTALAAFAAVTLLGSAPIADAAAYLKFDGVDGESVDADHDKWIDVLSIDWGMSRPSEGATGASRRRGDVKVNDFSVTKYLDKSSPKIMEACVTGEIIPFLELELTKNYGGARAVYLRYELKNVMVTSYNVSGSANGGEDVPTEDFSLNFEEIKVTYTENDSRGSSNGTVEANWKVEEGESR